MNISAYKHIIDNESKSFLERHIDKHIKLELSDIKSDLNSALYNFDDDKYKKRFLSKLKDLSLQEIEEHKLTDCDNDYCSYIPNREKVVGRA